MKFDVVIVGAGASGLAAAYRMAFLQPNIKILVLEKEKLPGRKLSAAGNGKCNLTNAEFSSECYYSEKQALVEQWVSGHSHKEILSFFEQLGIFLYQKDGYYYPWSNQGKQVTTQLYEKGKNLGVTYLFQSRAEKIKQITENGRKSYEIEVKQDSGGKHIYQADFVLLAAGGASAPKLGGSEYGCRLAGQLNLTCVEPVPVLSPIYVEDSLLSVAKGVRLYGIVKWRDYPAEYGQIQFNADSLSGIVIMNLSCVFNIQKRGSSDTGGIQNEKDSIHIDVLPERSWEELKQFFLHQKDSFPKETVYLMLNGILPVPFVQYLMKRLHLGQELTVGELTEKQVNRLTSSLKKLTFTPVYREDYEKSQVTAGGVDLDELNPDTFECREYENLYIAGEMLDVNGKCGGYNLTFAVLSGITAADSIIANSGGDD